MGWRRFTRAVTRVRHAVEDSVKSPLRAIKDVGKVATGDLSLDDAVKRTFHRTVDVFANAAEASAEFDREFQSLSVRVAAKVGGAKAKDIMADLNHAARELADPALGVAALRSVDQFVATGDLEYLNPINIYALREIESTWAVLYEDAHAIPTAVLNALHVDVKRLTTGVRWMLENDIPGNLTLPHFAIDHGNHAGAITLKNLIVFDRLPGSTGDDDLHLWAHELFHTGQYESLGVEAFTRRYLANELGFRPVGSTENPLEVEADLFACRYYPNGTANYLPGQACPIGFNVK